MIVDDRNHRHANAGREMRRLGHKYGLLVAGIGGSTEQGRAVEADRLNRGAQSDRFGCVAQADDLRTGATAWPGVTPLPWACLGPWLERGLAARKGERDASGRDASDAGLDSGARG